MSKEKFLKAYANVPEPERHLTIAIIENKTYSWDTAYQEITNDTELGKKIIKKLEEIGIL